MFYWVFLAGKAHNFSPRLKSTNHSNRGIPTTFESNGIFENLKWHSLAVRGPKQDEAMECYFVWRQCFVFPMVIWHCRLGDRKCICDSLLCPSYPLQLHLVISAGWRHILESPWKNSIHFSGTWKSPWNALPQNVFRWQLVGIKTRSMTTDEMFFTM